MVDLNKLLGRLIEHGVEFVVVGGFAATAHGASYVTYDLDICAPCMMSDGANLRRLHAALADLHPYHRMTMNKRTFVFPPRTIEETGNIYLKTDWGQLDVLQAIELGDYSFAREHSVVFDLPIGACRFLTCATLVESKKTTARPKDLLVAQQLSAILEATPPPHP